MGADHLFGVHRHQIAIKHRCRPHEQLAERNRGELEWCAAGLPHAPFDILGKLAKVVVAVVQIALGLSDADDRPGQVRIVQAHALGEGTPHEPVHIRVVKPRVGPLVRLNGHARAVRRAWCAWSKCAA